MTASTWSPRQDGVQRRSAQRRVVEVANAATRMLGSGLVVAPGLVLSALHVARPESGPVAIRGVDGREFPGVHAVWHSADLDAVLLEYDAAGMDGDSPTGVVPFGELLTDRPRTPLECSTTGFPQAMRRPTRHGDGRGMRDTKTVRGRVHAGTTARTQEYTLEVNGPRPRRAEGWQGLSGAGVDHDGVLIGFVRTVPVDWDGQVLMVQPAARLLADPGFAAAVRGATGLLPEVEAVDLPMLQKAPVPQPSPSYLLNAHARVVPRSGSRAPYDAVASWCRQGPPVDTAVLSGVGGVGKTRLLCDVLDALTGADGTRWSGGFLAEHPRDDDYRLLGHAMRPLLVVVDYAEAQLPQVRQLLSDLSDVRDARRVRVLLIARTHTRWWPALRHGNATVSCGQVFTSDLADALHGSSEREIYSRAHTAFQDRLGQLGGPLIAPVADGDEPVGSGLLTAEDDAMARAAGRALIPGPADAAGHRPSSTILHLHVRALADVLERSDPSLSRGDPIEVLLTHEEAYLRRIAAARLQEGTYSPELLRALAAAQYLTGAGTPDAAAAAVSAAVQAHHHRFAHAAPPAQDVLDGYAKVLEAAYPSRDAACWGAVGPDLLGTALIAGAEDADSGFVEHLLTSEHLRPAQQQRSLMHLARAAPSQPRLAAAAFRAVAAAPRSLLAPAITAGVTQLPREHAHRWLRGIEQVGGFAAGRAPDGDRSTPAWVRRRLRAAHDLLDRGTDDTDLNVLVPGSDPVHRPPLPVRGPASPPGSLWKVPRSGWMVGALQAAYVASGIASAFVLVSMYGTVPAAVRLIIAAGVAVSHAMALFVLSDLRPHRPPVVSGSGQIGSALPRWFYPLLVYVCDVPVTIGADGDRLAPDEKIIIAVVSTVLFAACEGVARLRPPDGTARAGR